MRTKEEFIRQKKEAKKEKNLSDRTLEGWDSIIRGNTKKKGGETKMPATRKDIAESLNRIANGIKDTAVRIHSMQRPKEKSLIILRLQNDARELGELTRDTSHLLLE